jgi:hypothetical protein
MMILLPNFYTFIFTLASEKYTMSKPHSEALFVLIKSLGKGEKRYFKLAESREKNLKFIRLFDRMDVQSTFDEKSILTSEPGFSASQFSNLKAHLYGKILKSLREYYRSTVPGIEIRGLIDEAQVLMERGLYRQSAKRLHKAEKQAAESDHHELQLEVLKWQKQLLSYTVDFEDHSYVEEIVEKVKSVNARINNINNFSNLQASLQALYRKTGYIRNADEHRKVAAIFNKSVPKIDEASLSISERIHLYKVHIGYCFYVQDFGQGLAYAEKWVELFRHQKPLRRSKPEEYIAGLNSLLIAQSKLRLRLPFEESKRELRKLNRLPGSAHNAHISLKLFKYTFVHEFNGLIMTGEFDRGVALFERLASGLESFTAQLDAHSRVILYYKTACLYFGNGDYRKCLFWLHSIFNLTDTDLREDIHGFARILSLICHFEMGNDALIPYQVRSTYRYLLKKADLHQYQKLLLNFLKSLPPHLQAKDVSARLKVLRNKMVGLQNDPYEGRSFVYFDLVAWLDSRIEGIPMMVVVKRMAK